MKRFQIALLLTLFVAQQVLAPANFSGKATFSGKANFGAAAGGGGPNTWYDVEPSGTGDTSAFLSAGSQMSWGDVTVGASGTATKARLYLGTASFGTDTLKMALYDSGGNLLASGTAATPNGTSQYVEVTFDASVAVTATGYKVAFEESTGNNSVWYNSATGTRHNAAQTYASFPPATLATPADFAGNYCVSVFVQ